MPSCLYNDNIHFPARAGYLSPRGRMQTFRPPYLILRTSFKLHLSPALCPRSVCLAGMQPWSLILCLVCLGGGNRGNCVETRPLYQGNINCCAYFCLWLCLPLACGAQKVAQNGKWSSCTEKSFLTPVFHDLLSLEVQATHCQAWNGRLGPHSRDIAMNST